MLTSTIDFCGAVILVLTIAIRVPHGDAFDIEKDLVFRLYTRQDPNVYYALNAHLDPPLAFDPQRPTRFFIHGFKSRERVLLRYKDAFLKFGNYNFIAVDWTVGANTLNYLKAKGHIQPISTKLAQLIDSLVMHGMKAEDVTIVGHR